MKPYQQLLSHILEAFSPLIQQIRGDQAKVKYNDPGGKEAFERLHAEETKVTAEIAGLLTLHELPPAELVALEDTIRTIQAALQQTKRKVHEDAMDPELRALLARTVTATVGEGSFEGRLRGGYRRDGILARTVLEGHQPTDLYLQVETPFLSEGHPPQISLGMLTRDGNYHGGPQGFTARSLADVIEVAKGLQELAYQLDCHVAAVRATSPQPVDPSQTPRESQ